MAYYIYPNYLQHHGIKGMKWGVRRYQNYDGTRIRDKSDERLKSENKRYEAEKKNAENLINANKQIAQNTSVAAREAKNATRSIESMRSKSKKAKAEQARREAALRDKLKGMSDDELRAEITRIRMEKEYASLTMAQKQSGWDTTREILDVVGGVASVAVAAAGIAGVIPLIHGAEMPDDLELYHHGVKGMHWGVRKDKEQHSANKQRMKDAKKKYKEAKKQWDKDYNKAYRSSATIHITAKGKRKEEKRVAKAAVSLGKYTVAKGNYMQAKGIYKGNNKMVLKGKRIADMAANSNTYYKTILKDVNSGYSIGEARSRHTSEYQAAVKREQDIKARYRKAMETTK